MVFDNLEVRHKKFGNGIVISKQDKYITVRFSDSQKIFVYPDIFENFLTLADGTLSDEIINDISVANKQKQEILLKKQEENVRAMTRGIVIPGKDGALADPEEEITYKSQETEEI
jgi:hypothetical protein